MVPLVDNASIETPDQEKVLVECLLSMRELLIDAGVKILFESDYSERRLADFVEQFPAAAFGINYDIGNSAALGQKPSQEIAAYGTRIDNVHIKDRVLNGTTVPLGHGNADFYEAFCALHDAGYAGNFILQTARANDGRHADAIARYRDMTLSWLAASGS